MMTFASVLSDVTNAHAMGPRTTAVRTTNDQATRSRRSAGVVRIMVLSRYAACQPRIDEAKQEIDDEDDDGDHRRGRDVNGSEGGDENFEAPRARLSERPAARQHENERDRA